MFKILTASLLIIFTLLFNFVSTYSITAVDDKYNFNDVYWIGRTRVNFDPDWDTFSAMSQHGVEIVDRVVVKQMGGFVKDDNWYIPNFSTDLFYESLLVHTTFWYIPIAQPWRSQNLCRLHVGIHIKLYTAAQAS